MEGNSPATAGTRKMLRRLAMTSEEAVEKALQEFREGANAALDRFVEQQIRLYAAAFARPRLQQLNDATDATMAELQAQTGRLIQMASERLAGDSRRSA
jgi:hypothetical protein